MNKVFCTICKKEVLPTELQVWLQTKINEFSEWNILEDLQFHNTCWKEKMQSIRQRGQDEALHYVKELTKNSIKELQTIH